jgi:predicted nuclease with TOPRIM domain
MVEDMKEVPMSDQETLTLLVSMIEKLDSRLASFQKDLSDLRTAQTVLNTKCESRGACTGDLEKRIAALEKTNERDEWKIFFKMTMKLAVFIILVGSTILFLYQVFEKLKNPAAPLPSMPSIP